MVSETSEDAVSSDQLEMQASSEEPEPPEPVSTAPPVPEEDPAVKARQELLEAQRAAEAKYAAAMEPVEAKVALWDFLGAWQVAEAIEFAEPELRARLDSRREEIRRMGLLKRRIIAKIAEANPPLKKSDLKIRGIGGEITDVGPAGITTKTIKGEVERLTWNDLGTKAAGKLMAMVVDPKDGEDCVAAGLLAFASGDRAAAERFLWSGEARDAGDGYFASSLRRWPRQHLHRSQPCDCRRKNDLRKVRQVLLEKLAGQVRRDLPWLECQSTRRWADVRLVVQPKHWWNWRRAKRRGCMQQAVQVPEAEASCLI